MTAESTVRIGVVFPDALGTYGDSGNAIVLCQRLRRRGIAAEVVPIPLAYPIPATCDLYLLGGGEDAAQTLAASRLRTTHALQQAVCHGAVVLAVCAGMQILGESFAGPRTESAAGLGLLDLITTARARRAVGDLVTAPDPDLLRSRLVGFENHLGTSRIGPSARPLARVATGIGNGDAARHEGIIQGRIIGTYLHGPVLARNPELADLLLSWLIGEPLPLLVDPPDQVRQRLVRRADRTHLITRFSHLIAAGRKGPR